MGAEPFTERKVSNEAAEGLASEEDAAVLGMQLKGTGCSGR